MKKQLMAGLIGAAAMLAMGATGAQARKVGEYNFSVCDVGTIIDAGGGYNLDSGMRTITAKCTTGADWAPFELGKEYTFSLHPAHDPDGQLAVALTALATGKTAAAEFVAFSYKTLPTTNPYYNNAPLMVEFVVK